jgi:hypothetical protein
MKPFQWGLQRTERLDHFLDGLRCDLIPHNFWQHFEDVVEGFATGISWKRKEGIKKPQDVAGCVKCLAGADDLAYSSGIALDFYDFGAVQWRGFTNEDEITVPRLGSRLGKATG